MIEQINYIKSITFDDLKKSPDIMLLLSLYSKLYMRGSNPGGCESCHKQYYHEICLTGIERAKQYEAMEKRTLTPNWNGIKYVRGAFYDSEMISDEQALDALINEGLTDNHFKKLPDAWLQKSEPKPIEIKEVKAKVKKTNK